MPNTHLEIAGPLFRIHGRPTYAELAGRPEELKGLLMNARFIQGVFDDHADPDRFARFGHDRWDPESNTDALIAALPAWYEAGLRAFTVGFQGGGPCFTIENHTIDNNPFGPDGKTLDPAYAARMDRLIRAADEIGMIVIVSLLYQGQVTRFARESAIEAAVRTGAGFLREGGYRNVILEVANEHDVGDFRSVPKVATEDGMAQLIEVARSASGGLPAGCSAGGGKACLGVAEASDVVLIHGNGQTRQQLSNLVDRVRDWVADRPVVCNEDSPCVSRLDVACADGFSWGYYNNMSKQEPPTDWSILPGEDRYFADRLRSAFGPGGGPGERGLGGGGTDTQTARAAFGGGADTRPAGPPATAGTDVRSGARGLRQEYYFAGFEPELTFEGKRWIRLASRYPEWIDRVEFFRNGTHVYTCWDEPYSCNWRSNWIQGGVTTDEEDQWIALVHSNGEVTEVHAGETVS